MTSPPRARVVVWTIALAVLVVLVGGWWTFTVLDRSPKLATPSLSRAPLTAGAVDSSDAERTTVPELDRAVRVEADGFSLDRLLDRAELRGLAQLGRGRFAGLVLAPDGSPCPDAELFDNGTCFGRSAADGAWSIERVYDPATSNFLLEARASGIGATALIVEGPSRRLDLQLAVGGTVRGRAAEWRSRQPIGNAEVELRTADGVLTTRTAPDGTFEFTQVPAFDRVGLRAISSRFDHVSFDEFPSPGDGEVRERSIELRPRVAVRGWFTPWPPRGASSRASLELVSRSERELRSALGADGRFELALADFTHWTIAIEADVFRLATITLAIPPDSPPIDLGRIELREPSTLAGQLDRFDLLAPFCLTLEATCRDGEVASSYDISFAGDGRFVVGPCAMQECEFELCFAGRPLGALRQRRALDPGQLLDVGVIAPESPLIVGQVTFEGGAAASQATVRFETDAARGSPIHRIARHMMGGAPVDAGGRFVARAPAVLGETVRLRVAAPEVAPLLVPIELRSLLQDAGTIVLGRGRTVAGRVLGADGSPLCGALVTLTAAEEQRVDAVTDTDGSFRLRGLASCGWSVAIGSYTINIDSEGDGPVEEPARFEPLTLPAGSDDLLDLVWRASR